MSNVNVEFVRGTNISYEFKTANNVLQYEFVMPQTFNIEFKKGSQINTVFVRPQSTLTYEFTIGKQGPKGASGERGSLWTSSPSSPSVTFGLDNDIHLNYSTYDLFQKIGGSWTLIGNIKGPVGPAGDGQGVLPTGGTVGQRLAKASGTDFDTIWVDPYTDTYIHEQPTTAVLWDITHNMNKYPAVTVVATNLNPEGVEVKGDVEYISNNRLQVTFSGKEINGKAYLN